MPDLLLELFSEEIPARMQAGAARDLERLMVGVLTDRSFLFEGIKAFAGPRRLTLAIAGLPAKQSDVREELKGPKTDAPPAALEGFLKKTGLTKDQLKVEKTPKGDVYMAVIERAGRETPHVLAEIIPDVMAKLPWPKSMRWPQSTGAFGKGAFGVSAFGVSMKWVRPLRSILCTFDGELVPFSFGGISSGLQTRGHRCLSEGKIEARRFDDYAQKLKANHVVLEAEERAAIIFEGLKQAAFVHGLEMIPDEGLLAEVCGLAEWPTVYVGTIQDRFMDVPAEILQTSMRTHQKYFSLRDPRTGKMANRFALVANMVAKDGGKEIVAGNERVLRARLSDAKFFWDEDRKHTLESRVEKLKGIVFHAKLGTQAERVERIAMLASGLIGQQVANSSQVSASVLEKIITDAPRAARISKSDLVAGTVGEFPEVQGVIGGYLALNDGLSREISDAIRDHYKPVGPGDVVPSSPVTSAVALADKFDTLTGFFAINEKPTGSGDPYALRRAALGVIRIILQNQIRIGLSGVITEAYLAIQHANMKSGRALGTGESRGVKVDLQPIEEVKADLLAFFADRLKVALKEKGVRHDLIDAVFSLRSEDDLKRLVARVDALQEFLKTDDGVNLLAGYKRAANILKVEEKKDNKNYLSEIREDSFVEPAERALFQAVFKAQTRIAAALKIENFAGAMVEMSLLRGPVDAFFEKVKVNVDNAITRASRLGLLAMIRASLHQVADFSKIEG